MNATDDAQASSDRHGGAAAASSHFLARCPVPGCDERLGPDGLTECHLAAHYLRDDGDAIVGALLRVWREHARILALEAASFEAIRSSLARDVIEALGKSRDLRLDALAVAVGERPDVVRGCLRRLIAKGVVTKLRKGVYRLGVSRGGAR